MKQLQKLAGETVLYGLGSIVPRFLNFLLVPLHTGVFNPEEYGVITKLFAYVAVVNIIFMFGMETAYFRFATKPGADEKRIFNLSQSVVIAISILLSLLFILLANPIAVALDVPGNENLIIWLAVIMFMDAVAAIPFARLRLQKKAMQFAAGKLINVFILVGLNVYFLKLYYTPSLGVEFVVLATLASNLFYLIFFARTLFSWRPVFDREISPAMFSYAYPVMITGLAGMTNEMFSRLTLEWWLPENFYPGQSSEYALGIFGACYKFGMLMSLTVTAFRYAAEPFFFSNASDKSSPQLFAKVNHYFIIAGCVVFLGVGINLDILKYFFLTNPAYWEGLTIVPILLLGYLFLGAYYNFSIWFKLTDRTHYGTMITVGGALITIASNFLLIPVFGYWGSSLATLICYFSMTVACYWLGQKFYPIPYSINKSLAYILITTLIVYAVNAVSIPNPWIATSVHFLAIGLYLVIVYLLEKAYFRQPVS
ncbi:MAG TPA: polysaccharide biosynthesis C-terminal domain-containing protein [Cyclobacteriaceae bacterium]|nr:polysaccharide biosynthesis C-terminal domain-containing protein [Cyclobacteriaceae bacterium]